MHECHFKPRNLSLSLSTTAATGGGSMIVVSLSVGQRNEGACLWDVRCD